MMQIAHGWELDVERGPDWLFVRPHRPPANAPTSGDAAELAEEVWTLLEQNFTRRLVLELDQLKQLNDALVEQLARLHERIAGQGGMMRITGLSAGNRRAFDRLPCFTSRAAAVLGERRNHPR